MNEAEWLASRNPAAMLEFVHLGRVAAEQDYPPNYSFCPGVISGRKVQLACLACRGSIGDTNEKPHTEDWSKALWGWCNGGGTPQKQTVANILREIVGNPCRPLRQKCQNCDGQGFVWNDTGGNVGKGHCIPCNDTGYVTESWLTPTVLRLATCCYEDRFELTSVAALHDALVEAGCDNEEMLRHLSPGEERCSACGGKGFVWNDTGGNVGQGHCIPCNDTGYRLLRTGHVRGCWVVDAILMKE